MREPRHDVAFFAPYIGPLLTGAGTTGGGETQVLLLARELASRGHRVAVATFGDATLPAAHGGIDVLRLPPPQRGAPLSRLAWRARLPWELWRALDAKVLVQRAAGSATGLVGLVARLRGRRFVYASASDMDFDFGRMAANARELRLFGLGLRLADGLVVQSEAQHMLARERLQRDAEVVPSLAEPASGPREQPEALLWMGRFAPYKRPLAFLDLAARVPRARFRIVGGPSPIDPELAAEVRRRAAALDNVELLAAVPRDEVLSLVRRAVAIVSTSEFEGMPNVFLEGWAHGVPALALSHDPGGVLDAGSVGWVAAGDLERMARLAGEAWDRRGDAIAIAEACRAHVAARHSPAAVAARWERVLFPSAGAQAGDDAPPPGRW
jgi:glycosyltransferase involved in cell wall biosynthesis